MRILKIAVLAAVMVLPVGSVEASVLGNFISFDGSPDVLDDDSVAFIDDRNADGLVNVGDVITGLLRIGSTTANGVLNADDQLIGLFSFLLTDVTETPIPGFGTSFELGFGAPAAADPLSIASLVAATGQSDPDVDPSAAGALIAVFTGTDPVDPTAVTFGDALAELSGANFSLDAILGIDPDPSVGDFLEVQTNVDLIVIGPGDGDGLLELTDIAAAGSGVFATELGGLSVLSSIFGPGIVFLPVDAVDVAGNVSQHDVFLDGSLSGPDADTPVGFFATDSTSLTFNAVPEATSLAVWGLLASAAGSVIGRCRK